MPGTRPARLVLLVGCLDIISESGAVCLSVINCRSLVILNKFGVSCFYCEISELVALDAVMIIYKCMNASSGEDENEGEDTNFNSFHNLITYLMPRTRPARCLFRLSVAKVVFFRYTANILQVFFIVSCIFFCFSLSGGAVSGLFSCFFLRFIPSSVRAASYYIYVHARTRAGVLHG